MPTTQDLTHQLSTTDGPDRADLLYALAGAEQAAGHLGAARLVRLLASSEALLHDPTVEPGDDPAWGEGGWWELATTTDRAERAAILTEICWDWAAVRVGQQAEILLMLAEAERALALVADAATDPQGLIRHEAEAQPSPAWREVARSLFRLLAVAVYLTLVIAVILLPLAQKMYGALALVLAVFVGMAVMTRGGPR